MKYIIIGKNPDGTLEWNACGSAEKAASFIKVHYKDVLEKCNYDWKLIHKEIFVLMAPDYQFATISAHPPVEEKVEVIEPNFSKKKATPKPDKFEIKEPVKVITRYLGKYEYFQLPDECLFFGDSYIEGNYCILWHGTTHSFPKEDVYKVDDSITVQEKIFLNSREENSHGNV